MQLTATNKERREDLSAPFSFPCLSTLYNFKKVWEQGLTMGREEADPLLLWDRHTLLIM